MSGVHPTAGELTAFALGLASAAESSAIELHLHECETCLETVGNVPDDALVQKMRDTQPEISASQVTTRSDYRGLRSFARGGLGEVWLGRDAAIGRDVAVKRLQDQDADDPSRRKRFLREAAVTGRLEHPGIAPVYGIGEDSAGRPCYSMRFIPGETLLDAIRSLHHTAPTPTELRPLLTHFVALCSTVAYAHSRGVVHRDIKPSNVAVGAFGETILLDWGIAQTDDALASENPAGGSNDAPQPFSRFATQAGTVLGTPGYMAPEQAAGGRVGPAADIFSLGATLWTLLTGNVPPDEAHSPPRTLLVVAVKAMANNPGDRYCSVAALAADIECWLSDQPLAAVQDAWGVRLRRWSRRHRMLVASTATALFVAAVGFAIAAGVLTGKNKELHDAVELANTNAKLAGEREAEALANFQTACDAVDKFTVKITEDPRLKQADLEKLRRDLLASATVFYRQLSERHGNDPRLLKLIVNAHIRLGIIEQELGNATASENERRTAIRLLEQFPGQPDSFRRGEEARVWLGISTVLRMQGNTKAALEAVQQAIILREESLRLDPTIKNVPQISATYDWWLARLTGEVYGDGPESDSAFRRAIDTLSEIRKNNAGNFLPWQDLPKALNDYAYIKVMAGRTKDAGQIWSKARAILKTVANDSAQKMPLDSQETLAKLNNNLSLLAFQNHQINDSAQLQQEALELYSRLRKAHPDNVYYRTGVAHSIQHLATLKRLSGKLDEAEAMLKTQLDESLTELSAAPGVADIRHSIIGLRIEWASIQIDRKAFPAAADQLTKAEALLKTVRNDDSPRRNLINGWKEISIRCTEAPMVDRAFDHALGLCEVLIRPETTASALEMLTVLKRAGCFKNGQRAARLDDALYSILKQNRDFQSLRDQR